KAGLPADTASLRHAGYPGSRKARATNYLLHPPPTTSATTSARFPQHLESGRSRAASPLFVKPPQNRIALLREGRRFPCSGLDAIDNGDRIAWSPFRAPHAIQLKIAIDVAPTGSCYLQTDSTPNFQMRFARESHGCPLTRSRARN